MSISTRRRFVFAAAFLIGVGGAVFAKAWAAVPPPEALSVLVEEMTRQSVPHSGDGGARAAAMTYSRAFAGYALVNAALEHPAEAAKRAAQIDLLIGQLLAPNVSAAFGKERVEVAGHSLSRSVAFRGHLALLLAGRARVSTPSAEQQALRVALLHGLAVEVHAASNHLLPSYGQKTYPADNEVLAAAFALAPEATLQDIQRASSEMTGSLDALEKDSLPASEVKPGTLVAKEVPRGCALSWTVAMRGLYAPERARRLYERYRKQYLVSYGPVVGFREWPPGVDRQADFDSGPIVFGIGTAASGIGLGATRAAGATGDYDSLLRSARIAGGGKLARQRGKHWLERAMWFWATSARGW